MASAADPARPQLRWAALYREADLYKAALRVYTKPLFAWRKALAASADGRTLYDFARHGLANLDRIHAALSRGQYEFRPGLALRFNFNGRARTLYVYPWEERVVDLVLYRALVRRLHGWLSPHAWAYRAAGFGVDRCQRAIRRALAPGDGPRFIVKRDIAEYFASVDHDILLGQLAGLMEPGDPLFRLLEPRVRFRYLDAGEERTAARGIPFGTAIACAFANIHLTAMDRAVAAVPGISYFRYADDLLVEARGPRAASDAADELDRGMAALNLKDKPSHRLDLNLATPGEGAAVEPGFSPAGKFRHLGLEFRADGSVGLSRDKFRKLCNLFRYAFRRKAGRIARLKGPEARAAIAIGVARTVLEGAIRNVAIIDYYLKHVTDEAQIRLLDRWLAEEVLALATGGGHRKGSFRVLPYARLRALGLPSLVHRRRLIVHGHLASPFFVWKAAQAERSAGLAAGRMGGTAARPAHSAPAFSRSPDAAASTKPEGEGAASSRVSWKTVSAAPIRSFAKPFSSTVGDSVA